MRKEQIYVLIIIFVFINVASLSMALYAKGETESDAISLEELLSARSDRDLEGIDGTPRFEAYIMEDAQPDTGNIWTIPVSDDYYEETYYQDFECILEGVHANIWIGMNYTVWTGGYVDEHDDNGTPEIIDDDTWYFAYPWSSIGIPGLPDPDEDGYYLPPGYRDWITGEDLIYVMDEFDNNIHDTVVNHFGEYNDRPGPLNDFKIQILLFNIRDGLFWDPITAPWFIAGYYSYYVSELNDANIFHMDSYQWWRRLGDRTPPLPFGLNPLPYQYEGTFAHEFQHLVHRDIDNDEILWVNEGCSVLAEWLCGYGFSPGHLSEYLIYWWDVSLVIWQSTLADYGVVFLWTFYMYEHYGGAPLIWDIVHEQADGIEGYNNVLAKHGIKKNFDEIFQDWAIANYLDDTSFAGGIYGYYALDIPSADTEWWDIPTAIWAWDTHPSGLFDTQVDTYPNIGYNYPFGYSLPYTVNYVEFYNGAPELKVAFDGDDFCGVPAYSGTYEWYSDGTPYSWFRLGQPFSIPADGATLQFMTYYEIEENYDYGYVEVHDLNTDQWYTLSGIETVSTVPFPHYNPNCDVGFNPPDYLAAGRWNALTGHPAGWDWYQEIMELPPDVWGHNIELYFTYWTDPYTLELGWYIDDIEITNGVFPLDDVEAGEDGWVANAGWYRTDGVVLNDFEVNFIETTFKKGTFTHHISPMTVNDATEEGQELLKMIDTKKIETYAVMVAANQPGYEHSFGTFYWFIADYPQFFRYYPL